MSTAAVAATGEQPRMEEVIETEETLKRFDPPGGQLIARPEANGKPVHKLSTPFSFWYVRRVQGPRTQENYERNIKRIATVDSIEAFWAVYNHLIRPNELSNSNDYHVFRAGIKPTWEDPANKRGGKFTVRLRKGFASRYWEDLLLAVLGEQFGVGTELCGIGVSMRYNEDILSVWNATADDHEAKKTIYAALATVMPLVTSANAAVDYKAHDSALQTAATRRRQQRAAQKKVTGGGSLNKSAPDVQQLGDDDANDDDDAAAGDDGVDEPSNDDDENENDA